mgnify:CR=1 FL=1
MQIITGIGESEHVTSMQHRAIFEMVIGNDSYILNKGELLEPELQSNNALKIRSGMLAHHGCISEVAPNTYDEVAIGNGSQSMKRIDLVVARYTQNAETKVERTEWTVIQGQPVESNPVAPDYIHGNMQDGDLTDDCPVFEVHLDGIQVVEIKKLLNVLDGSLAELNRKITAMPQIAYSRTITLQYSGGVLEGVIRDISDITANASAYAISITMLRNDSTPYRQVSQLTYEIRSGNLLVIHAWGSFVSGHMLAVSVIITKAKL